MRDNYNSRFRKTLLTTLALSAIVGFGTYKLTKGLDEIFKDTTTITKTVQSIDGDVLSFKDGTCGAPAEMVYNNYGKEYLQDATLPAQFDFTPYGTAKIPTPNGERTCMGIRKIELYNAN